MVEEGANVKNGDMAPQEQEIEDSAKLPLTDGSVAVQVFNDKEVDPRPNPDEYKGLTKDELMVYANDPKWKRLRIALMAFFWLGWLAMLAIAIVIIVQAPTCEPPPSTTWLQKEALLQLDDATPPQEAASLMQKLGLSSLYIPGLIDKSNYKRMNNTHVLEKVLELIQGVTGESSGRHIVTDFVPSPMSHYHMWHTEARNGEYDGLYNTSTFALNYSNPALQQPLEEVLQFWQTEYNVTGFLVPGDQMNPALRNLTHNLNQKLNPEIAIGAATVRVPPLDQDYAPFKAFLQENATDWRFYQLRPSENPSEAEVMRVALLVLMTSSGTPLFEVPPTDMEFFEGNFTKVIQESAKLRENDAIRYGETTFLNTTDTSIGFVRTLKGTPGYAIAANLDASAAATFDMTSLRPVPDRGSLVYQLGGSKATDGQSKVSMADLTVEPLSAVVLQFVAKE